MLSSTCPSNNFQMDQHFSDSFVFHRNHRRYHEGDGTIQALGRQVERLNDLFVKTRLQDIHDEDSNEQDEIT